MLHTHPSPPLRSRSTIPERVFRTWRSKAAINIHPCHICNVYGWECRRIRKQFKHAAGLRGRGKRDLRSVFRRFDDDGDRKVRREAVQLLTTRAFTPRHHTHGRGEAHIIRMYAGFIVRAVLDQY